MGSLNRTRRFIPIAVLGPALLTISAAVPAYAAPQQTRAAVPTSNAFMLVNAGTGKCLTIAGGVSTANNVHALQFNCDAHPSRRWRLIPVGGTYRIRNVGTGKCLTIAGGVSTANNVHSVQFNCDAHPSRRWILRMTGP